MSSLAAACYHGRNSTAVILARPALRRTGTSRLRSSRRCLRPRINRQPLSQVTKVFDYGILSMTACKNIVWTTSCDVVLRGWAFGLPEKKLEHPWNCEVWKCRHAGEPCQLPSTHGSMNPTITLGTSVIFSTSVSMVFYHDDLHLLCRCCVQRIRWIPSTSCLLLAPRLWA